MCGQELVRAGTVEIVPLVSESDLSDFRNECFRVYSRLPEGWQVFHQESNEAKQPMQQNAAEI